MGGVIYIYIYTWNPKWSLFLKVNPPKTRPNFQSKQGFGHLVSRYTAYIYIYTRGRMVKSSPCTPRLDNFITWLVQTKGPDLYRSKGVWRPVFWGGIFFLQFLESLRKTTWLDLYHIMICVYIYILPDDIWYVYFYHGNPGVVPFFPDGILETPLRFWQLKGWHKSLYSTPCICSCLAGLKSGSESWWKSWVLHLRVRFSGRQQDPWRPEEKRCGEKQAEWGLYITLW